ncbi:MAG: LysM peptidoglycan-binding domain-containing protein [Cyclobacteriaceae bacterium]
MKKLFSLLIFVTSVGFSQTVPREMDFGGMRLTIADGARRQIQKDVDRLTASQTYYGILVDRMNLYFPTIERAFAESKVPDEIKFLAVQESALISDAVSVANAVGFWQFKDFTAREVGLKVERGVDERLNIVAASYGAAKYLNANNFFYDNWIYAVMAYNTGRGGAAKLVDKSKYGAKKMTIDNKTHWYVKKFLAHVVAFSPAVGLPHSKNIWLDEETDIKGKTLSDIARKNKADLEEVKKYNKWLKRGTVPGDKEYVVLIPKEGSAPRRLVASRTTKESRPAKRISEPEAKIYPTEIKRGITRADKATIIPLNGIPSILSKEIDDVHSLSARSGISEKKFRKYNDMGPTDGIISSEFYYVKKKKGKSKIGFHVTKKGETLWDVSQQYGLQLSKLAKKNGMSIIDEVKPGRVLWLKKTRPSGEAVAYHQVEESQEKAVVLASADRDERVAYDDSDQIVVPVVDSSEELKKVSIHTVAPGESLWAIAQKYDVLMEDLLRWNELPNPDALGIGQNIRVKTPVKEVIETITINTHRVAPGETLYAISRKYEMTVDELMELNEMSSTNLDVGATLKVYECASC